MRDIYRKKVKMVEQQALAQTEDELNLLTLRLENIEARFKKLENEVNLEEQKRILTNIGKEMVRGQNEIKAL